MEAAEQAPLWPLRVAAASRPLSTIIETVLARGSRQPLHTALRRPQPAVHHVEEEAGRPRDRYLSRLVLTMSSSREESRGSARYRRLDRPVRILRPSYRPRLGAPSLSAPLSVNDEVEAACWPGDVPPSTVRCRALWHLACGRHCRQEDVRGASRGGVIHEID